jgi:hypothetical protein
VVYNNNRRAILAMEKGCIQIDPSQGTFRHISGVNCASALGQPKDKIMLAVPRSKTVAFVAILLLTTLGALATASAQPADIKAVDKAGPRTCSG